MCHRAGCRPQALEALDASLATSLDEIAEVVGIPSVIGTDAENEIQQVLTNRLRRAGHDEVDHWPIDLDALRADAELPGAEVGRRDAWGLVGRVAGSGDGPTLVLNGHVDVVPTGDVEA